MTNTRKKIRIPTPPHPYQRREPLPWHQPKSVEDDPDAKDRVNTILKSPSYRQADEDVDSSTKMIRAVFACRLTI